MKILSVTVQPDGNYKLLVSVQQTIEQIHDLIIPARQLLIAQGVPNAKALETMTEQDYLNQAIAEAKATLETPPASNPALSEQIQAAATITPGQVV